MNLVQFFLDIMYKKLFIIYLYVQEKGLFMEKDIMKLNISEAREKLTQLDKLLKPGEKLQITKRGKAYARIELEKDLDPYEEVFKSIEALPEPEENLKPVARHYKTYLYGTKNEDTRRI